MKNKPNPELIDDAYPEWTEAILSAAKTAAELSKTKTASKTGEKNRFAELCGILTSERSVLLEDMEKAIALQGVERFNYKQARVVISKSV